MMFSPIPANCLMGDFLASDFIGYSKVNVPL